MFGFLAPVKRQVVLVSLCFIACAGAENLTWSLLKPTGDIIQKLGTAEHVPGLGVWAWLSAAEGSGAQMRHALLYLALARLVYSLLFWARAVGASWQNMSMAFHMRAAVYDRLQRVGFAFYDRHSTGQLINRALGDLQNVRNFITVALHSSLDIVFSLIGCFVVLCYQCPPSIAATALLPVPLWFWAIRYYAVKSQPIYRRQMQASDEVVRLLTENLSGVHVVRAFGTEAQEERKYKVAGQTLLDRLIEGIALRVKMMPIIRGIATLSHLSIYAFCAIQVQNGRLTLGDLVMFGTAMWMILGKIQQINSIADAFQQAVVSSGRVFEILDTPHITAEVAEAEPLRPGRGAVRFVHVNFGYKAGHQVLKDATFSVPAGSVVALVGPTASGKSTLVALLARLYDVNSGRIEIDGQDIRTVTLPSVRDALGYVFQETYLFSDTIARNIAYADLDAPLEQIKAAARIAHADEFIEKLPRKYDTRIGEFGASLSGGQRQRLAIARAILHNPRILVLDDALASVDPETEALIRAGLEKIMERRTVFLITSRISAARTRSSSSKTAGLLKSARMTN